MAEDNLVVATQVRKEFGGLVATDDVDFSIPRGAIVVAHRSQRRGQDDVLQPADGRLQAHVGLDPLRRNGGLVPPAAHDHRSSGSPARSRTSGSSRNMSAMENVLVGMNCRLHSGILGAIFRPAEGEARRGRGARQGARAPRLLRPPRRAPRAGQHPPLRRPAAARGRARARDASRSCCCSTSRPPA